MRTIRSLFQEGVERLHGSDTPELEVQILLAASLNVRPEWIHAEPQTRVTRWRTRRFRRSLARRLDGTPLAYITGNKEFRSLSFKIGPGVLIPRPETEVIVDVVQRHFPGEPEVIVDMGTGCGNIAVALAVEFPSAAVLALDISKKALKTAKRNAVRLGVRTIRFAAGDLLEPLAVLGMRDRCDLIVSNPPYVTEAEWYDLAPEIRNHEPRQALVAGKTGFEVIRALVDTAPCYLKPGGFLIFEIGFGQKEKIPDLMVRGWDDIRFQDDLAGIPRCVIGRKT